MPNNQCLYEKSGQTEKIKFPVKRVAAIVASRAAAIPPPLFFFWGGGGGGKESKFLFFLFCIKKKKKENPSRPLLTHPAAGLETEVIFSLAYEYLCKIKRDPEVMINYFHIYYITCFPPCPWRFLFLSM